MSSSDDIGSTERIPLFPLNLVLYPGMPLPLHIFEPRYRRMVRHSLESGTPFGVVLSIGGGVVRIGCQAHVAHIVNEYDDGRFDVLCRGGERFAVSRFYGNDAVQRGDEVLQGDVELLPDEADAFLPAYERATQLNTIFEELARIAPVSDAMLGQLRTIVEQSERPSFSLMPAMRTEMAVQQRVLEMRSEGERLNFLCELLQRARGGALAEDEESSLHIGTQAAPSVSLPATQSEEELPRLEEAAATNDAAETDRSSSRSGRRRTGSLDPRHWFDQPPFCPEPMDRKNWYPMLGWPNHG